MLAFRVLALVAVFYSLPGAAIADAPRAGPLKTGPALSVAAYGHQNPQCIEWTNGCVVCTMGNGHAQCSTPGIACVPAGLTCKRHLTP